MVSDAEKREAKVGRILVISKYSIKLMDNTDLLKKGEGRRDQGPGTRDEGRGKRDKEKGTR